MSKKRTAYIIAFLMMIMLLFSGCDIIMDLLGMVGGDDNTTYQQGQIPMAPSNLTVSNVTSSSAFLSWNPVANANWGYKVYYSNNNNTVDAGTTYETSLSLNDLWPTTYYEFWVIAINEYGDSLPSNTVGTWTTEDYTMPGDDYTTNYYGTDFYIH